MIIGVPRERKEGEHRVALTPDGAQQLVAEGHTVYLEASAGQLSGFTDEEYLSSGAHILPGLKDLWSKADLLVKVKEPAPEELSLFRENQTVFCFHHPAACPEQVAAMLQHNVTGLSYDLLAESDGALPILEPMSVIAGKLSVQCGAYALQAQHGGRGVLLGGTAGVAPAHVAVIGAGASGAAAARVAIGMGAQVTIFDVRSEALEPFTHGPAFARTLFSSPSSLARELTHADLVIGAVLIRGALAPKLISRSMIATMKPGSVLVDISIDQGGISQTSRATSVAQPTYVDSGVVHYCVPNMPALVPRTSTVALTNVTLPWIRRIARAGVQRAVRNYPQVRSSLVCIGGSLANAVVAEALQRESLDETAVMALLARE